MGIPVAASLPSQRRQSHKAEFLCSRSSPSAQQSDQSPERSPMASRAAAAAPAVQTVVLRVSIHCHGCKKKVRKVLRSIEGVESVTVDPAQHKVTVTGNVNADTLVQRLHKSGKKGVPWQYCHPPANKTEAAPVPAPEALPAPPAQPSGDGGKRDAAAPPSDKKAEEAVKEPQAESSEKKQPEKEAGGAEKKPEAESKGEEKVEAKKAGEDSEAAEPPKAKGAEPAKEAAAAATKDAGKAEPVAVTTERSLPAPPPPAPRHAYEEEFRHPYYAPQPMLSYHAAQPSASVSYYAPQPQPGYSMQQPPPPQQQLAYSVQHPQPQPMKQWSPSYLYMPYPHAAPEPYYQDSYSPPGMHASPPPMQDSYRIFDDENPNSCIVM